jgi:hypothetical protein
MLSGMKTTKCETCGARDVKGSILHRKDCGRLIVTHEEAAAMAKAVLAEATGSAHALALNPPPYPEAVETGRLGGLARARNLSAERMSEIGRLAAQKRWAKAKEGSDGVAN